MDKIKKNIIANFLGKGWSVVSVYLFVPVYLHFLGIEAYGLIGFYAVLLGVLAFADMGLTATLSREMARLSGIRSSEAEMHYLVRIVEMVYLGISIFLAILVFVLASPISHNWLNSSNIPVHTIERSIRLMGFSVIFLFPSQMYMGGLFGLQRQVLANSIRTAMGTIRSGGAVLVLWLISPTVEAFFLWQVLSNVILLFLCRHFLWASLPKKDVSVRQCHSLPKDAIRYSIGMAIVSFNSIILMQVDKIAISKMLSLETLGYYSLASTLAQVPLLLSAPISVAVFPKLTQLMAAGKEVELSQVYHRTNQLVAAIVSPIGLILVFFSHEILLLWTQSTNMAHNTHIVTSLLTIGSLALAFQAIPFRLALSAAWTRLTIYLGICAIIIIVPLYVFLIQKYGVVGAGISWIALNSTVGSAFILLLHRRLLKGHAARFFLHDMAPFFLIALFFVICGRLFVTAYMDNVDSMISIGLIAVISCIVCFALYKRGFSRSRLNSGSTD